MTFTTILYFVYTSSLEALCNKYYAGLNVHSDALNVHVSTLNHT